MNTERPARAPSYDIYEGFSETVVENGLVKKKATLEEAMQNLWDRAGGGERRLRVIDVEVYGSNPIDMFHVIATDH